MAVRQRGARGTEDSGGPPLDFGERQAARVQRAVRGATGLVRSGWLEHTHRHEWPEPVGEQVYTDFDCEEDGKEFVAVVEECLQFGVVRGL